MHLETLMQVCESKCLEWQHQEFEFGSRLECYYSICLGFRTETPSNTRRYKGFCKPVAERDFETKPNRFEQLVLVETTSSL